MALFAQGTLLQVENTTTTGTYDTIPGVQSISGPTFEGEEVDVTDMDSTGGFREFLLGLVDPGDVTAELNLDVSEAWHEQLYADLAAKTARSYRIEIANSNSSRLDFTARVRTFPMNFPQDAQMTATLTLRVSGAPALTVL